LWSDKKGGGRGGVTGLHNFFAIRHEFDLEEPHKEKNTMNVKSKLAGKKEHDEQ